MVIRAFRDRGPSEQRELVCVEVPDAHVLCERHDVRVVASFEHLTDVDFPYPDLAHITPNLIVEVSESTDALGQKSWTRAMSYGDGIPPRARKAIAGLAQLLAAQHYTRKPADYRIVDPQATT